MTGTPKSLRAVVLSCWHCTHPDLDGTDTSLLAYLAFYSSGTSGGNAYPSNRNIADALGLTDTPTDLRLKKNIERGLIERTASAVGRKKASVYRLRLESPYFPDKTAGGERLVTDMPEDETNPGGETPYPHRAKSGKRPPQGVKTPYEEAENAPPGQAISGRNRVSLRIPTD